MKKLQKLERGGGSCINWDCMGRNRYSLVRIKSDGESNPWPFCSLHTHPLVASWLCILDLSGVSFCGWGWGGRRIQVELNLVLLYQDQTERAWTWLHDCTAFPRTLDSLFLYFSFAKWRGHKLQLIASYSGKERALLSPRVSEWATGQL